MATTNNKESIWRGSPRGKRDGVIGHISRRENVNWMWKLASLRDRSIWHPVWLGKLGVNLNCRHFLAWLVRKTYVKAGFRASLGKPLEANVVKEEIIENFRVFQSAVCICSTCICNSKIYEVCKIKESFPFHSIWPNSMQAGSITLNRNHHGRDMMTYSSVPKKRGWLIVGGLRWSPEVSIIGVKQSLERLDVGSNSYNKIWINNQFLADHNNWQFCG